MMDADLQHPPALISEMVEQWRQGADVVYAVRANRDDEGLFKRLGARLFYSLLNRSTRFEVPADAGDFRLLDRAAVDALLALPERNRFMKGLYAWIGFDAVALPYLPKPRAHGHSHFSATRLLHMTIDGLTSFTTWPLRLVSAVGVAMALVGFGYGAYYRGRVLALRQLGLGLDHHRGDPAVLPGRADDFAGHHGRVRGADLRGGEGPARCTSSSAISGRACGCRVGDRVACSAPRLRPRCACCCWSSLWLAGTAWLRPLALPDEGPLRGRRLGDAALGPLAGANPGRPAVFPQAAAVLLDHRRFAVAGSGPTSGPPAPRRCWARWPARSRCIALPGAGRAKPAPRWRCSRWRPSRCSSSARSSPTSTCWWPAASRVTILAAARAVLAGAARRAVRAGRWWWHSCSPRWACWPRA